MLVITFIIACLALLCKVRLIQTAHGVLLIDCRADGGLADIQLQFETILLGGSKNKTG